MPATVALISPDLWSIGSLMTCKMLKDEEEIDPQAVHSWTDDGKTYCLQRRSSPLARDMAEGDPSVGRWPFPMLDLSFWALSPTVHCVARAWADGLTTEATTIRWVNKNVPSVATEEVIYEWIDPEWQRYMTITRREPGVACSEIWGDFTIQQRLHVADQIAGYAKALSTMTSDYVETAAGTGIDGRYSIRERESVPGALPRIEERVSREDFDAFVKRRDEHIGITLPAPGIGEPLVFQTRYIRRRQVWVTIPSDSSQMPKATLLHWDSSGFLPKWWIATNPRTGVRYKVRSSVNAVIQNCSLLLTILQEDWRWMLSNACVRLGLPLELEYGKAHAAYKIRHLPYVPLKCYMCLDNIPDTDTRRGAEEE